MIEKKFYPFPFENYRPYQKEILDKAVKYLNDGIKVIIIDGPTGFGKSPVNIALARIFSPSFYTTPQKRLVKQLNEDFGSKKLAIDGIDSLDIVSLLGRKNYICRKTREDSESCSIHNGLSIIDEYGNEKKANCLIEPKCTYWKQKEACMESDVAILTFANLIVNTYLPTHNTDGIQISFKNRNLLIVDECQSLESQVAGMFAGFTISQNTFKYRYMSRETNFYLIWDNFIEKASNIPKKSMFFNFIKASDHIDFIEYVKEKLLDFYDFIDENRKEKNIKTSNEEVENKIKKIDFLLTELLEGKEWIINKIIYKNNIKKFEFKPIDVSFFLKEKIWSQADKIVLSSATIPYHNKTKTWLKRIGLENQSFKYLSVPSTFPIKNRLINFDYIGGYMTSKDEENNFYLNMKNIKKIMKKHDRERGVIHTVSYKRAKQVYDNLNGKNVFLHQKEKNNKNIIEEWQKSNKQCLISPSVEEGVDLKDDMCRFQILLKVPYLNIGDGRVNFLLNIKKDWENYYNETAMKVVQMYGRAVRHENDYATFYIIDKSFEKLLQNKHINFPQWFLEAIER